MRGNINSDRAHRALGKIEDSEAPPADLMALSAFIGALALFGLVAVFALVGGLS